MATKCLTLATQWPVQRCTMVSSSRFFDSFPITIYQARNKKIVIDLGAKLFQSINYKNSRFDVYYHIKVWKYVYAQIAFCHA